MKKRRPQSPSTLDYITNYQTFSSALRDKDRADRGMENDGRDPGIGNRSGKEGNANK
jgi:hypothetical protein